MSCLNGLVVLGFVVNLISYFQLHKSIIQILSSKILLVDK